MALPRYYHERGPNDAERRLQELSVGMLGDQAAIDNADRMARATARTITSNATANPALAAREGARAANEASLSARANHEQRAQQAASQARQELYTRQQQRDALTRFLVGTGLKGAGALLGMVVPGAGQAAGMASNGIVQSVLGGNQVKPMQGGPPGSGVPQSVGDLGGPTRFDSVPQPPMSPAVHTAASPTPLSVPPNPYGQVSATPAPGSLAERQPGTVPQLQSLGQLTPTRGANFGFPSGDPTLLMRLLQMGAGL